MVVVGGGAVVGIAAVCAFARAVVHVAAAAADQAALGILAAAAACLFDDGFEVDGFLSRLFVIVDFQQQFRCRFCWFIFQESLRLFLFQVIQSRGFLFSVDGRRGKVPFSLLFIKIQ